jgi:hypothetical protein
MGDVEILERGRSDQSGDPQLNTPAACQSGLLKSPAL